MNPIKLISLQELSNNDLVSHKLLYTHQSKENKESWVTPFTPYRSSYYAFALCIRGHATFQVNLQEFKIVKGSLIFVKNNDIKQWFHRSEDYETYTILFEKEAILNAVGNQVFEQDFDFFNKGIVVSLTQTQQKKLKTQFEQFGKLYATFSKFQNQQLAHYLAIMLYSTAELTVNQEQSYKTSRSKQITNDFIKLASKYVINERNLDFYSQQIGLSKKHLSETIKSELNKTASQILGEYLLLEAKVMLNETTLTIEEIAFHLNFNDSSAFNKFFKRHTGLTPKSYRN
ncbi:MAG: helix-turn-helix domain-containing protein [Chitinophagales bacterium]